MKLKGGGNGGNVGKGEGGVREGKIEKQGENRGKTMCVGGEGRKRGERGRKSRGIKGEG